MIIFPLYSFLNVDRAPMPHQTPSLSELFRLPLVSHRSFWLRDDCKLLCISLWYDEDRVEFIKKLSENAKGSVQELQFHCLFSDWL